MKRQRGRSRNNNYNKSQNPNRALESNGPGVKVRGAVATIHEKYQQLARDASLSGDRVMAENYLQYAEHYFRVMHEQQAQREQREEEQNAQRAARQAQFEARKAQQQERNQQPASPQNQGQDDAQPIAQPKNPQPAQNKTAQPASNGTGPMDVVMPAAIPEPKTSEPLVDKPARTPRRRVRRPAAETKTEAKPVDAEKEPSA